VVAAHPRAEGTHRRETSEAGRYHLKFSVGERAPQPVLVVVEALSEHLDSPLFSPQTKAQKSLEDRCTEMTR